MRQVYVYTSDETIALEELVKTVYKDHDARDFWMVLPETAQLHPKILTERVSKTLKDLESDRAVVIVTWSDAVFNAVRLAVKQKVVDSKNIHVAFYTKDLAKGQLDKQDIVIYPNARCSCWPKGSFLSLHDDQLDALLDD